MKRQTLLILKCKVLMLEMNLIENCVAFECIYSFVQICKVLFLYALCFCCDVELKKMFIAR